jgi:hypothetical protein
MSVILNNFNNRKELCLVSQVPSNSESDLYPFALVVFPWDYGSRLRWKVVFTNKILNCGLESSSLYMTIGDTVSFLTGSFNMLASLTAC